MGRSGIIWTDFGVRVFPLLCWLSGARNRYGWKYAEEVPWHSLLAPCGCIENAGGGCQGVSFASSAAPVCLEIDGGGVCQGVSLAGSVGRLVAGSRWAWGMSDLKTLLEYMSSLYCEVIQTDLS